MYVSAMKIRNALLCKHHKVSKVSLRYGNECPIKNGIIDHHLLGP